MYTRGRRGGMRDLPPPQPNTPPPACGALGLRRSPINGRGADGAEHSRSKSPRLRRTRQSNFLVYRCYTAAVPQQPSSHTRVGDRPARCCRSPRPPLSRERGGWWCNVYVESCFPTKQGPSDAAHHAPQATCALHRCGAGSGRTDDLTAGHRTSPLGKVLYTQTGLGGRASRRP